MTVTEKYLAKLQTALDYLSDEALIEEHRATLKRAVEAELLRTQEELENRNTLWNEGKPWKPDEIELLEKTCQKKGHATGWTDASEFLEMLALRLKRSKPSVKRKATELGCSDAVDWWLAKTRHNLKDRD